MRQNNIILIQVEPPLPEEEYNILTDPTLWIAILTGGVGAALIYSARDIILKLLGMVETSTQSNNVWQDSINDVNGLLNELKAEVRSVSIFLFEIVSDDEMPRLTGDVRSTMLFEVYDSTTRSYADDWQDRPVDNDSMIMLNRLVKEGHILQQLDDIPEDSGIIADESYKDERDGYGFVGSMIGMKGNHCYYILVNFPREVELKRYKGVCYKYALKLRPYFGID